MQFAELLFFRRPLFDHFQGTDLPKLNIRTIIGIIIAITGNVLISLALNLQKLAHRRMEEAKNVTVDQLIQGENGGGRDGQYSDDVFIANSRTPRGRESELQPLLPRNEALTHENGTQSPAFLSSNSRRPLVSRLNPTQHKKVTTAYVLPVNVISENTSLHGLTTIGRKPSSSHAEQVEDKESDYLKSKLWWSGFLLMNIGETGNFISYAFAPASMVAPLGTFALMANCFFAPLLLGEQFKKRDLLGVVIAIIGAVTVVLASNVSDTRLDSDALLRAISSTPFIVYSCVYLFGALVLATLSEGKIGKTYVFVDVGLCALFGGFTVLSTKALSTLLTLQWIEIFTHRLSYVLLLVLILTGVGQIRYLNRALMKFDSKVVIPTQFVFFTLSAIIGSAILYGDFRSAKFHGVITFLYGCAATFAGVFIIAWSPKQSLGNPQYENEEERDEVAATGGPEVVLEGSHFNSGSLSRRRRIPRAGSREAPPLRRKPSSLATIGISPAQHLLLVHSPTRDVSNADTSDDEQDLERGSVGSFGRNRYGSDSLRTRNESGVRDNAPLAKRRNGSGLALSSIEGSM